MRASTARLHLQSRHSRCDDVCMHVGVVCHILPVGQNACGYFSDALRNAHVCHITR